MPEGNLFLLYMGLRAPATSRNYPSEKNLSRMIRGVAFYEKGNRSANNEALAKPVRLREKLQISLSFFLFLF